MANIPLTRISNMSAVLVRDKDSLTFHDPTDTNMTVGKAIIISVLTTSNVFMLLGNSFSIYIILRCHSLHKHTYYWLVLNLAVLDLLNSLIVVPLNIVWEFHGQWPFGQSLCDFEIFCDLGFSIVAAYSTVLLSLDKYFYITKPFFYYTYVGSKVTLASILTTWLACMTYSAASVFGELARSTKAYKYNFPLDKCNFVLKHAYVITSFIIVFFIPLVILLFTSCKILCVARQHLKKINANHRTSHAGTSLNITLHSPAVSRKASIVNSALAKSSNNAAEDSGGTSGSRKANLAVLGKHRVAKIDSQTPPSAINHLKATTTSTDSTTSSSDIKAESKSVTPASSNAINKSMTSNTVRAFGTVALVILAYIIMFAPYWTASVINLGCLCIEPMAFEDYLAVFYYMHSLVNPYIYMATDKRYKKAIRQIMAKSMWCRRCRAATIAPIVQD